LITSSGRHIQIIRNRNCPKCGTLTEQICHKVRYQQNSVDNPVISKRSYWVCPLCQNEVEEVTDHRLPGDKARIINRLLAFQEDYAIQSMNIESHAEKLVVKITVKE